MKITPEEILELRREESKRFNTRIVMFWKWLQSDKGFSESTASSYVFGISGFFSYYDLDLKLKGKIPDTKMKIESYQPKLEDIQKVFRLGDLEIKTTLSIMRDVPCRVGDLVKEVIPRIQQKEFLIESEKEEVVGKCYISDLTLELHSQLEKANLKLPNTKRGIAKLLERASNIAGIPKFNPHLVRKYFFTVGCNLNINRDVLKVLMFKSVSKDILTYLLNRTELKDTWQQIINQIPLEAKSNGRINDIQKELEELRMVMRVIARYISPSGISEDMSEDMEILKKFLEEER
jgi:integrase